MKEREERKVFTCDGLRNLTVELDSWLQHIEAISIPTRREIISDDELG